MGFHTKSCNNAMSKHPALAIDRKTPSGISGYSAKLFSLHKKKTPIQAPPALSAMTLGIRNGNVASPKLSPSSSMAISPRIVTLSNQSMALIPTRRRVRGLWRSRKKRSTKAVREMGRSMQKIHRQEMNSVKNTPRSGSMSPATAKIRPSSPMYRIRSPFGRLGKLKDCVAKIREVSPHAEKIRNGDIGKLKQPSVCTFFACTSNHEYFHCS
jgi:hypothetical protein